MHSTQMTGVGAGADAIEREQTIRGFVQRLHDARIRRGWTQSELGRHAGLQRSRINDYVNGRVLPSEMSLNALARALNVQPEWLLPRVAMVDSVGAADIFRIDAIPGNPGMSRVTFQRTVSSRLAAQIMLLLEEEDAVADAG